MRGTSLCALGSRGTGGRRCARTATLPSSLLGSCCTSDSGSMSRARSWLLRPVGSGSRPRWRSSSRSRYSYRSCWNCTCGIAEPALVVTCRPRSSDDRSRRAFACSRALADSVASATALSWHLWWIAVQSSLCVVASPLSLHSSTLVSCFQASRSHCPSPRTAACWWWSESLSLCSSQSDHQLSTEAPSQSFPHIMQPFLHFSRTAWRLYHATPLVFEDRLWIQSRLLMSTLASTSISHSL